jgi:hypothetical protein
MIVVQRRTTSGRQWFANRASRWVEPASSRERWRAPVRYRQLADECRARNGGLARTHAKRRACRRTVTNRVRRRTDQLAWLVGGAAVIALDAGAIEFPRARLRTSRMGSGQTCHDAVKRIWLTDEPDQGDSIRSRCPSASFTSMAPSRARPGAPSKMPGRPPRPPSPHPDQGRRREPGPPRPAASRRWWRFRVPSPLGRADSPAP